MDIDLSHATAKICGFPILDSALARRSFKFRIKMGSYDEFGPKEDRIFLNKIRYSTPLPDGQVTITFMCTYFGWTSEKTNFRRNANVILLRTDGTITYWPQSRASHPFSATVGHLISGPFLPSIFRVDPAWLLFRGFKSKYAKFENATQVRKCQLTPHKVRKCQLMPHKVRKCQLTPHKVRKCQLTKNAS
jgi:hypothetical protein